MTESNAPSPPAPLPGRARGDGGQPSLAQPAQGPPADAEITAYIDRQARAARLAAAVEPLATEPSLKDYKDEAQRYLARAYPDADLGQSLTRPPSGKGAGGEGG